MTQYEVDKLLESSHLVSSFVGNAYVKMYKSTIVETKEQHIRDVQKLAMDDMPISKVLTRRKELRLNEIIAIC